MNNRFFQHLLYFVLLIILQDWVIDKLPLGTYISPELYLIFILLLPFNYNPIGTLLWAFAMGLTMDIFSMGILGLHTASLVALAYARPLLLKLVSAKDQLESNAIPSSKLLGMRPFFSYIVLSVFLYTTILFCLDTFNFAHVGHLFLRILLSSIVTTLFIVAMQYAFTGKIK